MTTPTPSSLAEMRETLEAIGKTLMAPDTAYAVAAAKIALDRLSQTEADLAARDVEIGRLREALNRAHRRAFWTSEGSLYDARARLDDIISMTAALTQDPDHAG